MGSKSSNNDTSSITPWVGGGALLLLTVGTALGLGWAPAERYMGDVQRIMYVHVPTAWVCLLCFTAAGVLAAALLWTDQPGARATRDARMASAVEVGVVLNALLLVQGMIWGKATWGVWWDWDVRLTTSLVMLLLFIGVLALRSWVQEPSRRATWSAVAVLTAYADVPLVYFCVRWWRSLHQVQSSPETVDAAMVWPLRLNAVGMLLLAIWLVMLRSRLHLAERALMETEEPEPLIGMEAHHA